ncbi:MAG: hemerythrin family protein [Magnetococcales bacterium]|nr:hemerythrin family protein [Magnetococcales bacterium]
MTKNTDSGVRKAVSGNVDKQHAKVFEKISKLSKSIKKMSSERTVFHKLFSLARYAEKHFLEEEELMFLSGYRQHQDHKRKHREFIQKIGDIKAAYNQNSRSHILPGHVRRYLGEWLEKHIDEEDADVLAWLNNKDRTTRFVIKVK